MAISRNVAWFVSLVVLLGIGVYAAQRGASGPIKLVVECNRGEYYVGEPILLRTRFINDSQSPWQVKSGGVGIVGEGFEVWYKAPDEGWQQYTKAVAYERPDRAFIKTPLSAGSAAERIDLLIPERPGRYTLKVAVEPWGQARFESSENSVEVAATPSNEPLLALLGGDREALRYVGLYIFYSHYGGSPHAEAGAVVLGRDGRVIMKSIAPLIAQAEAEAPSSLYLPYLQYAFVCNNASDPLTSREVTALLRRRAETLWSNSDPTFWLKPQAGLGLFNVYRALGLTEQARTLGDQLLQNWPQSALLRNSALQTKLQALPVP